MSYYTLALKAGTPVTLRVPGTLILIDSIGVASGVDVTAVKNGASAPTMPNRRVGFRYETPFDELILQSAVDATVALFATDKAVNLGFADGGTVAVTGGVTVNNQLANPVPVTFTQTIAPLGSVTVNNTSAAPVPIDPGTKTFLTQEQRLLTIVDIAPVAVGTALVSVLNDPTLLNVRFRNTHATAKIGLGGASLTSVANAAIVLQPGEICYEDDAAGAHWYAISDTAGASLSLSGLKP